MSNEQLLRHSRTRGRCIAVLCATGFLSGTSSTAQAPARTESHSGSGPVAVRYSEGTAHGFVELRNDQDSVLAYGDLLQVPGDSTIESRLLLRFEDTSVMEETTTFSQHQVFRLVAYHLVQQGPAFPADLDATLSADGQYVVTSRSHKDGRTERHAGRMDLPGDVANGLPVVLAKNLRMGDTADVHLVAFTPKPRLIGLRIAFAGSDTVMVGSRAEPMARFVVKPLLGALTAFFARLLGKLPPDSQVWIIMDRVPAFFRFKGPMYLGPVWRLSLTNPTWRR